ncbi:hypothetical protein L4D09_07345 [Photobacterium makurazakiensis]
MNIQLVGHNQPAQNDVRMHVSATPHLQTQFSRFQSFGFIAAYRFSTSRD